MPKRKFTEPTNASLSNEEELQRTLSQGQTQLFRALKLARGFERQKLGRRQKDATKTGNGTEQQARLQAEVDAVKALDIHVASEFYLRRTLARTTSIAAAPDFPDWLKEWAKKPSPFQGTAMANVTARLFKSVPVRAAMDASIQKIRHILRLKSFPGPNERGLDATDKAKAPGPGSVEEARLQRGGGVQNGHPDTVRSRSRSSSDSATSAGADSIGSDESFDRFERYMDRIAESSDERSHVEDAEHKAVKHGNANMALEQPVGRSEGHNGSGTVSGTKQEEGRNLSESSDDQLPVSSTKKAHAPPKSTTFLPSLSMGGYISGSESDPGSSDVDAGDLQIKKNRRGQRARRAIWEKKYGSGARHVKKDVESRDAGWDARKGATEAKAPRERKKAKTAGEGVHPSANGMQDTRRGPKKGNRDDEGKLHPSWEAAKQAKEAKRKITFSGTKVTFD